MNQHQRLKLSFYKLMSKIQVCKRSPTMTPQLDNKQTNETKLLSLILHITVEKGIIILTHTFIRRNVRKNDLTIKNANSSMQ